MSQIKRNKNTFLNIPADGLEYGVIKNYDASVEEYRENIKKYLALYLENTSVGTVLFNVFYRRSIVDSDFVDSMYYNIELDENLSLAFDQDGNVIKTISPESDNNFIKGYRYTIKRNIDIVKMAIEEARKYDVTILLSVRMNDHHDIKDPGLNSSFSYNNFEKTSINGDGEALDYCKEEVRNYYGNYIIELCNKYDIDGIELDFLRTCPIMSCVNDETTNQLTEFIASVKNKAETESGKALKFTARIYPDEKTNLAFGIDAAQWISQGIVDTIAPEAWYIPTYYGIDANEWKKSIDAKNVNNYPYSVLPGTDWAVRCDSDNYAGYIMWITLEQFKGFVSSMYQKGADGIYIFNHFLPDSDLGAHTYYIDKSGVKTCKNIIRDKMIVAGSKELSETGMRVYVNTCSQYYNTLYPISISKDRSYTFTLNTASKPKKGYFKVIVGIDNKPDCDKNIIKVSVNGNYTIQIDDVQRETGFKWQVSKKFEPPASHVSEVAHRVMQFNVENLNTINDGFNTVKIECDSLEQSIKWLEIHVEDI